MKQHPSAHYGNNLPASCNMRAHDKFNKVRARARLQLQKEKNCAFLNIFCRLRQFLHIFCQFFTPLFHKKGVILHREILRKS